MHLHRRTRKRLALGLVGWLLCVQWMVAAFACPPDARGGVPVPVQEVLAASAVPNCHEALAEPIGPADEALCKAHCSADSQLPASATSTDTLACHGGCFLPATTPELPLAALAAVAPPTPSAGAPPGWPPLYLIHQVLRN